MLDKMAFFVYVIRLKTISSASRKFNISVSAGTRWIQELEQHFGITLFHRTNRILELTSTGQILYEEFSPIVDRTERIEQRIDDFLGRDKGIINIVCTPVYANHYLMEKISSFSSQFKNINFNITITPWALDHANTCDLMISANASYLGYKEKDLLLIKRELMQSPFVVVASETYLQDNPSPTTPEDLENHRCLFAITLTGSNEWIFQQEQESTIIKVPKTVEVNDSDLLLQGVLNGIGIAYLPLFVVKDEIENGNLTCLLTDYKTSTWSLNLYYHPPKTAVPIVTNFKEFLLNNPH
ncbi:MULTISPECIES: LysR family transcriptional regulator [Vibrio]|uniref:LysR family transcriptional regulator n=1 Tax=Vibrio TaxID=662 RepID=UPI00034DC890|nr:MULTISPECIES: LysR family transcriptional regulator [Vibrio]